MPLFALEQIVLLSFAERERAADARRLHVCARARAKERNATGGEERDQVDRSGPSVLFPVCFASPRDG